MKSPIILSLQIAGVTTLLSLIFGTMLARIVLNHKRTQTVCDIIATLPMVFPPTVTGFLLLKLLGKSSLIGQMIENVFRTQIVFTFTGAAIASFVVTFPLMYRTTLGAFQQVDEELLYAGRTLGLSEVTIFFRILLPIAKNGIISGIVLTFTRALGEFGATIIIAGNIPGKTQTLSIAIYQAILQGNDRMAYQYAGIMIAISISCLLVMNLLIRRSRQ